MLPLHNIKKEITNFSANNKEENNCSENNNYNINTSHTVIIHLNNSKNNKDGKINNNNKNQKNDLINSRSLNDILKKYYMMSDKKEVKKKKLYLNYHCTNKSHLSQHKIIKNEYHNSKNKRTKSDFNCLSQNSNDINPKNETKDTENKLNENHKKYNNILNNNIISIKNNNSKCNNHIKYCETSKNKIRNNSKTQKANILKTDLRNNKSPKIKRSSNIKTEKKSNQKYDIISEAEFLKELQNTIKNNPNIITLNDLLNCNYNLEDSKNLNTTSATSLLGKIEKSSVGSEEKYNLVLKNVKEEIEYQEEEYLNGLCDEFTRTERIKRSEPFLSNQIPLSNYEIKINRNKKELKLIDEMNKDELMQTNLIYKNQYEKYMEKLKKYEKYINLDDIKQIYKDTNNLDKNNIKIILNKIMDYLKKKIFQKKIQMKL